jgi:hypothetical protein
MSEVEPAMPEVRRKPPLFVRIVRSHDFLRDLTVTTLGVLIALGIGEIVEEIRWKFRVQAAEDAMEKELKLVNAIYREQLALQPCITRRISELSEVLADARRTGRLPDVRNVSYTPHHGSAGDSWTLLLGTEIPLHMEQGQLVGLATAWVNEDAFSENTASAREAFHQLRMIEGRAGPVSDNVLTVLEAALTKVQTVEYDAWYIANRDSRTLEEAGATPSLDPNEPWDEAKNRQRVRQRLICQPLQVDGKPYGLKGPLFQYAKGYPDNPVPD